MQFPTRTQDIAPVPGFLEAVDDAVMRIDLTFAAMCAAFRYGMATAQAQQAQRPTEASQRGVRAHVYAAGIACRSGCPQCATVDSMINVAGPRGGR